MGKFLLVLSVLLLVVLVVPFADAASGQLIDVYTQRGGIGQGEASRPFKVGELVVLFADVKNNGVPLADKLVEFHVYGPPNPYENYTTIIAQPTNSSGIASVCFRIGPIGMEHWKEKLVGTWQIIAETLVDHEILRDSVTFECDWDLTVDLFTQRGGEGFGTSSNAFKAGEVVSLYMRVMNRTVSMPNMSVEFRVQLTSYNAFTNESGIATVSFRLPWKVETTYKVYCDALMRSGEYAMYDYIEFDCLAGERIPGDMNYDMKVDIADIAACALSFGSYPGRSKWNPECDLNGDNDVDIKDLAMAASNFGKRLP